MGSRVQSLSQKTFLCAITSQHPVNIKPMQMHSKMCKMKIIPLLAFWCQMVLSQIDSANENNQELPCVIKYNQLYCTSPGSSYPATSIASFVEDNRALLRSARHWLPRVT